MGGLRLPALQADRRGLGDGLLISSVGPMTEAVPARAAVLVANELGHENSAGTWHLRSDGTCRTVMGLVVLPEGRRAAELGHSILQSPDSVEWRRAGLGAPQR